MAVGALERKVRGQETKTNLKEEQGQERNKQYCIII